MDRSQIKRIRETVHLSGFQTIVGEGLLQGDDIGVIFPYDVPFDSQLYVRLLRESSAIKKIMDRQKQGRLTAKGAEAARRNLVACIFERYIQHLQNLHKNNR